MSKDYKGYELIKAIRDGEIKENSVIEVHSLNVGDNVITEIKYINRRLIWDAGEFNTGFLCDDNYYFRVVEEQEKIDKLEIDENGFIHTNNGTWKGRKLDVAFAEAINKLVEEVKNIKEK